MCGVFETREKTTRCGREMPMQLHGSSYRGYRDDAGAIKRGKTTWHKKLKYEAFV